MLRWRTKPLLSLFNAHFVYRLTDSRAASVLQRVTALIRWEKWGTWTTSSLTFVCLDRKTKCAAAADMTPTLCILVCVFVCTLTHAPRRCQSDLFGLLVYGVWPFLPSDVHARAMNRALCVDAHPTRPHHLNAESIWSVRPREREGEKRVIWCYLLLENRFPICVCG